MIPIIRGLTILVSTIVLGSLGAEGQDGLRLRRIEGSGIGVKVETESGLPATGAAVTFQLPSQGPTGLFASGMRTEIVTADQEGRAWVRGIQWSGGPGQATVKISASFIGRHGSLDSNVDVPARSPVPASAARASFNKKWLWIGLAAGGALGALALGAHGGSSAATPAASAYTLPPTTPTLGAPVVSVGPPTP